MATICGHPTGTSAWVWPGRALHLGGWSRGASAFSLLGFSVPLSAFSVPLARVSSHPPTCTQRCAGLAGHMQAARVLTTLTCMLRGPRASAQRPAWRCTASLPSSARQAVRAVFTLQTFGTQRARSGSRACTPPTTTRPTPASWYEPSWEAGRGSGQVWPEGWGNRGPAVLMGLPRPPMTTTWCSR